MVPRPGTSRVDTLDGAGRPSVLLDTAVDPAWRHQGIGRRLVEAATAASPPTPVAGPTRRLRRRRGSSRPPPLPRSSRGRRSRWESRTW
ncbi:GNAT family N-acetyltransferase [Micromonospora sp. NPDC047730]|uniref:GNAT family N-acetyltransferase n=1 Tax=Micromonospora sp. NPDC047730 TaxID=3364253 RepID=UPI003723660F